MRDVQKRIRLLRLAEKIKNNQQYAKEIGVSIIQKNK